MHDLMELQGRMGAAAEEQLVSACGRIPVQRAVAVIYGGNRLRGLHGSIHIGKSKQPDRSVRVCTALSLLRSGAAGSMRANMEEYFPHGSAGRVWDAVCGVTEGKRVLV